MLSSLRTGDWLTLARLRLVAWAIVAAFAIGYGYLIVTARGVIDAQGRPLGTDFSNVYAAGTYVLEGRPEAPFDPALQHQREQALFGDDTPFYGWHYPPFFLFIAGALALMPYGLALAAWQAATFLLYLVAMRAILVAPHGRPDKPAPNETRIAPGHLWLLLAGAYPAVFVNLGHGHNGFLSAALMAAALVVLDRRPLTAGVLLGLLAYKPQFGLLAPLVLAATGRWRTFASAAATVVLLAIITTLVFGPQVWDAFLASARFTRLVILEAGDTGWHKIQSVFAWARMWGGSVALAYTLQAATTAILGAALIWLWRSSASFQLRAAGFCIAAMLATPYCLDYDMMVLAPAIAFFAADGLARGFGPYEKTALAALWLVPLFARSVAQTTFVPLGVIAMLAVFTLLIRRALAESAVPAASLSSIAR